MTDFEKYTATLNAELTWYYKRFTYFSRPNMPVKPETSFMHELLTQVYTLKGQEALAPRGPFPRHRRGPPPPSLASH